MIQFTQKEIEHLRKKKNECPQAILRLEEEVKDILEEPLLIPKQELETGRFIITVRIVQLSLILTDIVLRHIAVRSAVKYGLAVLIMRVGGGLSAWKTMKLHFAWHFCIR